MKGDGSTRKGMGATISVRALASFVNGWPFFHFLPLSWVTSCSIHPNAPGSPLPECGSWPNCQRANRSIRHVQAYPHGAASYKPKNCAPGITRGSSQLTFVTQDG